MNKQAPARRLTRGTIEARGRTFWNRHRVEMIDPESGEVRVRQARMKLGRYRTAAEATRALDQYLAVLSAPTLQPGIAVTFGEYTARFDRLRVALMRRQSQRLYRSIIRTHLLPELGARSLSAIDPAALQELVAALHAKGLAPATVRTALGRAREILRAARADGFAAHSIPRSEIKLPSASTAERDQRHITPAELERILQASEGRLRVLWAILGFAGLRIGEALGLAWGNILLPEGTLLVRQAATAGEIAPLKTRTARRDIPMLPELKAILTEWGAEHRGAPDELIFQTRTGRPLRADDVRARRLRPLLRRLGLPPAGAHAFRHGLPGRLDALGLSPAAIQRFMGHSTLAMTERYLHRSTSDLREQLDAALRRVANTGAETP